MPFLRPFLFAATAAALTCLAGCSTDAAQDDTDSSADELSTSRLRSAMVVKGSVVAGDSITVKYEPDLYNTSKAVPFLAVELLPTKQAAASDSAVRPMNDRASSLTVQVEGNFPGSPRLLVVDQDFNVVAGARGVQTDLGDQASVIIPADRGKKFVLVRDMDWVAPMNFQITTSR